MPIPWYTAPNWRHELDCLRRLVGADTEELVSFKRPALVAGNQVSNRGRDHWSDAAFAPESGWVVVVGVEDSALCGQDAPRVEIRITIGECGHLCNAVFGLHMYAVPPRQMYGVSILALDDAPAGVVRLYGWRLPAMLNRSVDWDLWKLQRGETW